jgi:succinoglycan biosynthesis protein ExoM
MKMLEVADIPRTDCSITIVTYKRPAMLRKLLQSIGAQRCVGHYTTEIIVVDNDPQRSGEPVVQDFKNGLSHKLLYFVQPKKNISLSRNLAVANARGSYIAFIDDDEYATENWLAQMIDTAVRFDADGVFGPVVPDFHPYTPAWLRNGHFFEETLVKLPTGSPAADTWSGNCLIKAPLLKSLPGPFDESLGTTGGEDTNLFDKLAGRGARFVYCAEAVVYEAVPPERTTVSYLMRKALRGGNVHTRRTLEQKRGKAIARLFMVAKALCQAAAASALAIVSAPSRAISIKWATKIASNVGRFLAVFNWHYQAYK